MAKRGNQRSIFLKGSNPNYQYDDLNVPAPAVAPRYSVRAPNGARYTVLEAGRAAGSAEVVDFLVQRLLSRDRGTRYY